MVALILFAPALATAAELDIAGLRLGMSPDEARQALIAFGAPTAGDYRGALLAKYGPPDQDKFGVRLWMRAPGKGECKPRARATTAAHT